MNNFQYVRAEGLDGAARFVAGHAGAKFIGGGTNLVDLMKYNVEKPSALVDLNRLSMRDVSELPDGGLRIGALVTNSDVAYHPTVSTHYPLLSRAILAGASAQRERQMRGQLATRREQAAADSLVALGYTVTAPKAGESGE